MEKKVSEFTKRKRSLKDCADYIDPTRCTRGRFDLIEAVYQSPSFKDPMSQEFKAYNRAVQFLLTKALVLNRQPFWDSLEYSSHMPDVPEPESSDRHRKLSETLDHLRLDDPDHEDLDSAMSVLADAVTSMRTQFVNGEAIDGLEGVSDEMRYMCAAMLTAMSTGLGKLKRSYSSDKRVSQRTPARVKT